MRIDWKKKDDKAAWVRPESKLRVWEISHSSHKNISHFVDPKAYLTNSNYTVLTDKSVEARPQQTSKKSSSEY